MQLPLAPLAAAFGLAAGLATAATLLAPPPAAPKPDPCALPSGIDLAQLPDADRSFAARHAIYCEDLEHGRIDDATFHSFLVPPPPPAPPAPPPAEVWASSVRSFSSQWSDTSWSAAHALGAPDVYPASGDQPNAWASQASDAATESLEVGFDRPRRIAAIDIFETLNPGAVVRVDAMTPDGRTITAYQGAAEAIAQPSYKRHIELGCTADAVDAVKITLDSAAVPGWNEIDAVGVVPCD